MILKVQLVIMKIQNLTYYLLTLILLLSAIGCYKDTETKEVIIKTDIPEVLIDHNMIGTLITDQTTPVKDAVVMYDNNIISLDNKSYFYAEGKQVNKYYEPLKVSTNSVELYYQDPNKENETNYHTFVTPSVIISESINANENLAHDYPSGVKLSISSETYRIGDAKYSGQINFSLSSMPYKAIGSYPGGRILQADDGELYMINPISYIIIDAVEIDYFEGTVDILEGDLYYYNESSHLWQEVNAFGQHTFAIDQVGLYVNATSTKYSTVSMNLTNFNTIVNGEKVIIGQTDQTLTHTTDKGSLITYIQAGTDLNLTVQNDCSQEVVTTAITQTIEDLGTIDLNLESYKTYVVRGSIKDCNNLSVEKSLLKINFGEQSEPIIKLIDKSDFSISVSNCDAISNLSLESELLNGEEVSQILAFETKDTIDVYHIHVCSGLSEEYLSIQIEDTNTLILKAEAILEGGKVKFNFYSDSDNTFISFATTMMRQNVYMDEDLNIVIQAPELGEKGYQLDCGTTNKGCGFEEFIITEYGEEKDEFIRGYYKGRFWVKTLRPIVTAGYKDVEGVFHIRRDF